MNKPVKNLPFIFVSKAINFIFKFLRYVGLGLFVTLYVFIDVILTTLYLFIKFIVTIFIHCSYYVYRFLKYSYNGVVFISYLIFRFLRYSYLGVLAIGIAFVRLFKKLAIENEKQYKRQQIRKENERLARERNQQIREENKKRLQEIKEKEQAEINKKKEEEKKARTSRKAEIYKNENVIIEKKKISDYINDALTLIGNVPKKIADKIHNNTFAKNARNKKDINREILLLDLEGEDAEKSAEKVMYKYIAKNPDGKVIKGFFPAFSKVEVHSFLLSEGNEVYSIETNRWIQLMYGSGSTVNKKKIKVKDLIFFTTQLSTYIKAGIPLVEALRILSRQFKNKTYSRIFRSMIYDLTMGDSFSVAMDKQGEAFPRLLINMIKASEMTGELPEALDDMCDYFTETDKTKKQMITALTYPAIVLFIALIALVFIMVWVVPQFVAIYSGMDGAEIPGITVFIMNVSEFLQNNWLFLIIGVAGFITVFVYLYKNVKVFKAFMQWIIMHMPVFGNVVIYNEVTMFTKTFSSLLSHNVFITDSMEILNKLTNNEIYKMLILDTINNLAKGEKISLAFKDHWAFPIPAYEMITTGEMTGQLPEMMSKVSAYYQELHRNAVARIKTFIEPVMILGLTAVVGVIVLSIVIPMFNMYTALDY